MNKLNSWNFKYDIDSFYRQELSSVLDKKHLQWQKHTYINMKAKLAAFPETAWITLTFCLAYGL